MAEGGTLSIDSLPPAIRSTNSRRVESLEIPPDLTLDDIEKSTVLERLERFSGNRTQTAVSLGISVRTLQRRLKRWDADEHQAAVY
jgi:DNA-binding NtrC family response regulator